MERVVCPIWTGAIRFDGFWCAGRGQSCAALVVVFIQGRKYTESLMSTLLGEAGTGGATRADTSEVGDRNSVRHNKGLGKKDFFMIQGVDGQVLNISLMGPATGEDLYELCFQASLEDRLRGRSSSGLGGFEGRPLA